MVKNTYLRRGRFSTEMHAKTKELDPVGEGGALDPPLPWPRNEGSLPFNLLLSVLSPTVDTSTLTSVEDIAELLSVVPGSFVIFFSNKFCNSNGQCLQKHHK